MQTWELPVALRRIGIPLFHCSHSIGYDTRWKSSRLWFVCRKIASENEYRRTDRSDCAYWRPDLNSTLVRVTIAYYMHVLLCKLDDTFLLQFFDGLHYAFDYDAQRWFIEETGRYSRKKVGTFSIEARNRILRSPRIPECKDEQRCQEWQNEFGELEVQMRANASEPDDPLAILSSSFL